MKQPYLADTAWLARVSHILSDDLRKDYLNRMRAVRQNCRLHRWKQEPAERAVA